MPTVLRKVIDLRAELCPAHVKGKGGKVSARKSLLTAEDRKQLDEIEDAIAQSFGGDPRKPG